MSEQASDLQLAQDMAQRAGQILLDRFRAPARGVSTKSSANDLVSDADQAAEDYIVGRLAQERPQDGILAEEGARDSSSSGRRWVIDPLDGTTNYLHGIPHWAVSIALEDEGGTLLGVVYDPCKQEMFHAERGQGCWLDQERIQVSEQDHLSTALVATGFGSDQDTRERLHLPFVQRALPRVRDLRRAGAASLDLAWVAAGRVDGFFEPTLSRWDMAAGGLLVQEAGGEVEVVDGDPCGVVAAAPGLFAELREMVEETSPTG